MASQSDGGVELGKRPHIPTHRMQEFITAQKQGEGGSHKLRMCKFEGCNRTFTSAPGLRYHIKSHNTESLPFVCSRCRKQFKSNNGLKYHEKNTKCEEQSDSHASETDDHDEPDGRLGLTPPHSDPPLRLDPEFDGMDNLRELAIIATGPQSPLLQKTAPVPWDKPGSTSETDSKVSPTELEFLESFSSPLSPVWQSFMKGSLIKFLSPSPPLLDEDWHTVEELANHSSSLTTELSSSIFNKLVELRVTKIESVDLERSNTIDLYLTTEPGSDSNSVHLVAQCAQHHPFYVKDKGWSSFAPDETMKQYSLSCQQLAEQDLCQPSSLSLDRYELSPLDSTAVLALSSMAQQKKNQERKSQSLADSPSKEDLPKAKRPMNAFMLYAKENRIQCIQKYPGRDNREISVLLGDEWNKLSEEEKKKFKDKSDSLAKEQKQLHPDCWKRKK